jgi:hypothetical protein
MNITVQHVDGMRFLATADQHTLLVDAAPDDGGAGTAMSSPQVFAAGLGACILEFVANSCRLRGIPVHRLRADVAIEELFKPRRLGAIQITIHMEPEPSGDLKRRLMVVARHATLATTLARPPVLDVRFSGKGD